MFHRYIGVTVKSKGRFMLLLLQNDVHVSVGLFLAVLRSTPSLDRSEVMIEAVIPSDPLDSCRPSRLYAQIVVARWPMGRSF